jgi:hypothetical protein
VADEKKEARTRALPIIHMLAELFEMPCMVKATAPPMPKITTNIKIESELFCLIAISSGRCCRYCCGRNLPFISFLQRLKRL